MFITPIEAHTFEILADKRKPIIGLKVVPIFGSRLLSP